jgi:hypothetical protein
VSGERAEDATEAISRVTCAIERDYGPAEDIDPSEIERIRYIGRQHTDKRMLV